MNESTKTKKALRGSLFALFLCIVLLIGTTFAWFTDTASTGVNKIQSGRLDVDLEYATAWNEDGSVKTWESAEGQTLDFVKAAAAPAGEAILWEPGCTYELPQLRVVNNGNLALKYKIKINGIQGDEKLNEVIDWTINDTDINLTEQHLTAGQAGDAFTIKGHMQETAGNEYQGLSIEGISITVVATQDTVENDSYGNQYDANATYPVSSQEELDSLLENAPEGTTIVIPKNTSMTLTEGTTIKSGMTLSGAGADKTILKPEAKNYEVTGNDVTIKDLTIDGTDVSSIDNNGVIKLTGNNAVLDGVKVIGGGQNTYGHSVRVDNSAGTVTAIKNSTVSGAFRGLQAFTLNGTLLVENTTLAPQCYCLNIDGGTGKLVVNKSILKGWTSYTDSVTSAAFTDCTFEKNTENGSYGYNCVRAYTDTTFVNCDFGDEFWFGAANNAVTVTFDNCRYKGKLITNSNVNEVLEPTDNANTKTVVK